MIYALDTNIISFLLRRSRNPEIVRRFEDEIISRGNYYTIPSLVYYETHWGLLYKGAPAQAKDFDDLYAEAHANKLQIPKEEILKAAEIKADLKRRGKPNGANDRDIFIAANCILNGYTLITDNTDDFQYITGLEYVNWKEWA